jgi:hypothetical protein
MTVISTLILKPTGPDVVDEFLAQAQKAQEVVRALEGVDRVLVGTVVAGGPMTNAITFTTECADWETYGKIQAKLNSDPELIGLLMEAGKIATWETYLGQEIDFSLL